MSQSIEQKEAKRMGKRLSMYSKFKAIMRETKRDDIIALMEKFEADERAKIPVDVLSFGQYSGDKVGDVMRLAKGRQYLYWLVKQSWYLGKEENVPLTKLIYSYSPVTGEPYEKTVKSQEDVQNE